MTDLDSCENIEIRFSKRESNNSESREILFNAIPSSGNVRYIWTSGRKCNFNGCDRPDLQPQNVNGWFWSGSGAKIGPTSQRNSGDWSHTGGYGQPQPDNREAAQVLRSFPFSLYFPFDFVRPIRVRFSHLHLSDSI